VRIKLEYEILNEEGTRYVPKIVGDGQIFQVWVKYWLGGKERITKYNIPIKQYIDGRWKKIIEADLISKEKSYDEVNKEKNVPSGEDRLKEFKKKFVGKHKIGDEK